MHGVIEGSRKAISYRRVTVMRKNHGRSRATSFEVSWTQEKLEFLFTM